MQKRIALVLWMLFIGVSGTPGADFITQLQSENPLSRSPVIQWTKYSLQNQEDSLVVPDSPIDGNFFKSALIPGWGQYSQGKTIRSGVFLGIEVAAITGYVVYDNKYEMKKDEFQTHAENNWDLQEWLNYYNPEEHPSTHSIHIRYKPSGKVYSYPSDENFPAGDHPEVHPDQWEMVWDHEGYENSYKYDQFAAGWITFDPSNPDNTETSDHLNPERAKNKDLRDTANDFADTSMLFVSGLIFNHLASAFETVFFKPADGAKTGMQMQMRYQPKRIANQTVNTVNFELRW